MDINIQLFNNPRFEEIRIVNGKDGKPMFVTNDVASVFGYANPKDAVATHCKSGKALKQGFTYVPQNRYLVKMK